MSIYKTTTELATSVLQHLGELAAGEAIDTEDDSYITGVYNDKWEELADESVSLAYWPKDDIPTVVFLIVRDLIANEVRAAYGQPMAAQVKENEEITILRRLRRHVSTKASGHRTRAEYF